MTEEELRALLQERGLARVADALLELAAPTVRVNIHAADEQTIPVGASKIGGRPDLPVDVDWPSFHEPMAFIAQFNLAAVAPYDRVGALPRHGLLSFFYETNGEPLYAERWGLPEDAPYDEEYRSNPASWRALYHEGNPATFIRRDIPSALNEFVRFSPCAARFAAEVTLPDVDGPEIWPLQLGNDERSVLIHIDGDVNHGTWEVGGHHLLGYPYNMEEPTLVRCDTEARGVPDEWPHADPERRREIERAAAHRWRLLLQLPSSGDTAMDWAGGGVLHFCIEREALRRRDFARVWVNMQFL